MKIGLAQIRSTFLYKKQVCLYQWDYMINCNENENNNGKIDHINKTYTDIDKKSVTTERFARWISSLKLAAYQVY